MENDKIFLNVGGKILETTKTTLLQCKDLTELVQNQEKLFIDRDPEVFMRTLKFLRGYPIEEEIINDEEVLHELIYWKHDLVNIKLPECISCAPKVYSRYDLNQNAHVVTILNFNDIENPTSLVDPDISEPVEYLINTTTVDHLNRFKNTHYMIPDVVSNVLDKTDNKLQECDVVCSKGWNTHVWIKKDDLRKALYKLKLKMTLYQTNDWCVCGKH